MHKKYLVVASKKDSAGTNITTHLSQFKPNPVLTAMSKDNKPTFDFHLVEESILETENLNLEKINKYDFIIFASKHSSKNEEPALTIHAPGNFGPNHFGGEEGKVCKSSALFQKQLFENLNENAESAGLTKKYSVTMEATHHGPLIEKPCLFIEIGATRTEWEDRRAGFTVAKTISETINSFEENPYNEIAIAVGGNHYCQSFNKIQKNSNVAISHVIPKYLFPLKEEMIREAIEKTSEEVDLIVVDWKGLGNAEQKKETLNILDNLYIQYKKTGEISKG